MNGQSQANGARQLGGRPMNGENEKGGARQLGVAKPEQLREKAKAVLEEVRRRSECAHGPSFPRKANGHG